MAYRGHRRKPHAMTCACGAHFLRERVVNSTGEMAPAMGIVGAQVAKQIRRAGAPAGVLLKSDSH
jgi:hypothetical protein